MCADDAKKREQEKSSGRGRSFVLLPGALISLCLCFPVSAKKSAPGEIPKVGSYELHFLLDASKLLDENLNIQPEYAETFALKENVKRYGLCYLDTGNQDFHKEGWINRIRLREDKASSCEVTCKKRYTIEGQDLDGALAKASADGLFDAEGGWEAEVEVTYSGMTLSVSKETKFSEEGVSSIRDLKAERAKAMVREAMPQAEKAFRGEGWGSVLLSASDPGGPVSFKRYEGAYQGQEIRIELWSIRDGDSSRSNILSEFSLKVQSPEDVMSLKATMIRELGAAGILLERDSLKTKTILDCYFGGAGPDPARLTLVEEKAPSCTEEGNIRYYLYESGSGQRYFRAGQDFEEISRKDTSLPSTGHDYGEPVYNWSEDHLSLCAERVCKNNAGHVETETVSASEEITAAPGCLTEGKALFTSAAFKNPAFQSQSVSISLPAKGHDFGGWTLVKAPTTSEEGLEERVCKNDPSHVETRTVPVIRDLSIKKKPVLKSVLVKKKTVTVTFQKPGKKLLKKISRLQVQLSSDRRFTKIIRSKWVGKKKMKVTLKLKKKGTCYLRARYAGAGGFSPFGKRIRVRLR